MLFFIGMDIPQKGILYTPVRPAKSTPKNAQNSQNLSKRGQNRPNFCIFVAKKIAKTLSSLRAESARAFTGRRNSHSGRGEDFLTGQSDFFTETAVSSERNVEKSFPR